eukprot:TRINITY_DN2757_c0_g1_i2.p1 TRINITY_DN2757_c0_g1~~TRINITY_DN2757_c0_g1_i2.p1  ORF type:complete len:381 (-),score=65.40 TRINITY_DN2757_c0_g1_i2:90-1157(-)
MSTKHKEGISPLENRDTSERLNDNNIGSDTHIEENGISYISQKVAQQIDEHLVNNHSFTLDVLMELAGLSVAQAIADAYHLSKYRRVLVISGPGNNGGDGLVCARHLYHFGYTVTIVYPKRKPGVKLYNDLVKQCTDLNIPILNQIPFRSSNNDSSVGEVVVTSAVVDNNRDSLKHQEVGKYKHDEEGDDEEEEEEVNLYLKNNYDIIIDAIFGFSFTGEIKEEIWLNIFKQLDWISKINNVDNENNNNSTNVFPVIASIDIPSGWKVDDQTGKSSTITFMPDFLISLSAPKLASINFRGKHHYLGGRFLPPQIVKKFNLKLPSYPSYHQFVKLPSSSTSKTTTTTTTPSHKSDI